MRSGIRGKRRNREEWSSIKFNRARLHVDSKPPDIHPDVDRDNDGGERNDNSEPGHPLSAQMDLVFMTPS